MLEKRLFLRVGGATALIWFAAGCGTDAYFRTQSDEIAPYHNVTPSTADLGRIRFLFDDMSGLSTQTLNTNAFPWKAVTTALLLAKHEDRGDAVELSALPALFGEYGFITPSGIANWQGDIAEPKFSKPIGLVTGTLQGGLGSFRLEVANVTCAVCHAGVTYDAEGNARDAVWLGNANTSVNFAAFAEDIRRAMQAEASSPDRFVTAIHSLYPEMDHRELETIRNVVLPAIAARLARTSEGHPLPYHAGASGLTNGLGSLKNMLGLLPPRVAPDENGVTSNPDLSGVTLRSALLFDGSYAPKGAERFRSLSLDDVDQGRVDQLAQLVTMFTVPAMGVAPRYAINNQPHARDIAAFLATIAPPPFPGSIDSDRAARGAAVYRESCAGCHGRYSDGVHDVKLKSFPNRLVPLERIGTDPVRSQLAPASVGDAIAQTPFGAIVDAAPTGGYVAPRLNGVWATAPYLHNGSVPTLWHLMHPTERPAKFTVGGHRLDFSRVGIDVEPDADGTYRYRASYRPWARPSLYDTTAPGFSNRGHERYFDGLAEAQKTDLLEYLKLL